MNKAHIAITSSLLFISLVFCLSPQLAIAQSPTLDPIYKLKQELQGPNPPATLGNLILNGIEPTGIPSEYRDWSRIGFESFRDGNYEIYLTKWDREGEINLTNHPAIDRKPRLARASNQIVFYSNRDGDYDIYRMNSDGSNLVQLNSSSGNEFDPAWSPDGRKIVYVSGEEDGNQVYVMNVDGSGSTRLTFDDSNKADPAWSPDGNQIAYVSYDEQALGSIWIMDADGSSVHTFKAEIPFLQNPVWSPDGIYLAYDADTDYDYWNEVLYTHIQSGQSRILYDPSPNENAFVDAWMGSWLPDSNASAIPNWLSYTKVHYAIQGDDLYIAQAYVERIDINRRVPERILGSGYDMSPDWQTMDIVPPTSKVNDLPLYSKFSGFDLSWSAQSFGLADLANFDLDYRFTSDQDWFPFTQETTETHTIAQFENPGETVFFRSRARDQANNLEAWPASDQGDASTTLYTWQLQGLVTDNRGYPFRLIPVSAEPAPLNSVSTDRDGKYSAYLASEENLELQVSQPGFGSWPVSRVAVNSDQTFDLTLPPKNNLILNSSFEETALEGWETAGSIRPNRDGSKSHSGTYSARLGKAYEFNAVNITNSYEISEFPEIVRDIDGQLYSIWNEYGYPSKLVYSIQETDSTWTEPASIMDYSNGTDVMVSPDGTLHVVGATGDTNKISIDYSSKPLAEEWTSPIRIIGPLPIIYPINPPSLAVDGQGTIHVVWSENNGIIYTSKAQDTSWSTPQLIIPSGSFPQLAVDSSDNLHLIWIDKEEFYDLFYSKKLPGGEWLPPENFTNDQAGSFGQRLAVGPDDRVHVSWIQDDTKVEYIERFPDGSWSNSTTLYDSIPNFPLNQTLMVSPDDYVHIVWTQYDAESAYRVRYPDGVWSGKVELNQGSKSWGTNVWADNDGLGQVVWAEDYPSHTYTDVYYTPVEIPRFNDTVLKQTIHLPKNIHQPTLSFEYLIDREVDSTASFQVRINDTPVLTISSSSQDWAQHWIDLTPWIGQTIELAFIVHSTNGSSPTVVHLDDVAIGPWLTPVVSSVSPHFLEEPESETITITGENFLETPTIYIGSTKLNNVQWIDERTLTAEIPPTIRPGVYDISVTNPGGQRGLLSAAIRIGRILNLPAVLGP